MSSSNTKLTDELVELREEAYLRDISLILPEQFFQAYLSDEREDLYQDIYEENGNT